MSETFQILEFVQGDAVESVDEAACIIRGVKVLGEASRNPPPNNNLYPASTRQKALSLIEGAQVCVNHPDPDKATQTRAYQDVNGTLREARDTPTGSRANWHLNPMHALTKQILWDAKNNPKNLGFSINGDGRRTRDGDGHMVVEEIRSLVSVDLVSRPATTNGLFEALRTPVKKKISVLIEELKAKRPGYARALREAAESGIMSPDATMDEPAPTGDTAPTEDADHEVALKAGFKAAVNALMDDSSLDAKTMIGKFKDIVQAQEKLLGGGEGGKGGKGGKGAACAKGGKGDDGDDSKDDEAMESLKLQNVGLRLLMEARITPDDVLLAALESRKTEADIKKLIESAKVSRTNGNGYQARSGYTPPAGSGTGTVTESKIPEKAADWGASLVE